MPLASGNRRKEALDTEMGPWVDWEETNLWDRAIRFIETYCRNPKGYGYGKPMVLNKEQKEWIHDILQPDITAAVKSCMRGEGKSTECAALAIWRAFDKSESGAGQVPIIATTVGQAKRSIYNVVLQMVRAEPELYNRSVEYAAKGDERVYVPSTESDIFPIANDVDGLQGLDPLIAFMDEIGFQSIESWDAVMLASGKRPDSLVLGVGTPGFNRNNALWQIRKAVLENGVTRGFVFKEIAAPDGCDYKDEKVWMESCPALRAGFKNINAMRTSVAITPEAHFRIFYLGQWVEGTDGWLGEEGKRIWDAGEIHFTFREKQMVWLGLDVGIISDTSALITLGERDDRPDTLHLLADLWIPSDKRKRIDISDIQHRIRGLCDQYNVQKVNYDPRSFELAGNQLLDEGLPMCKVAQSWETLSPVYMELYRKILDGQTTHEDDERFRTQILNGVGRYNERGFVVSKEKSNGKIDATVALCLAFKGYNERTPERAPIAWA